MNDRDDFDEYRMGAHDPQNHTRYEDRSPFYLVECGFNNDRFAVPLDKRDVVGEIMAVLVKPKVHLIGLVIDVTDSF